MTPQTLMNDLVSETLDPKEIILLVVGRCLSTVDLFDSNSPETRRGAQSNW